MRIQRFCFSCNSPGVRLYPFLYNHAFGHYAIFSGKMVTAHPPSPKVPVRLWPTSLTIDLPQSVDLRSRLHGEFQSRLKSQPGQKFQPRLKFCCDYMTNFSPGWNISLGAKFEIAREKRKTLSLNMPKLTFQPGLKFECDHYNLVSGLIPFKYWKKPLERGWLDVVFHSEFQPGRNFLHVNASVFLRRFVQEAELRSQPGLKFAM